jgi:hypothetical protein
MRFHPWWTAGESLGTSAPCNNSWQQRDCHLSHREARAAHIADAGVINSQNQLLILEISSQNCRARSVESKIFTKLLFIGGIKTTKDLRRVHIWAEFNFQETTRPDIKPSKSTYRLRVKTAIVTQSSGKIIYLCFPRN